MTASSIPWAQRLSVGKTVGRILVYGLLIANNFHMAGWSI